MALGMTSASLLGACYKVVANCRTLEYRTLLRRGVGGVLSGVGLYLIGHGLKREFYDRRDAASILQMEQRILHGTNIFPCSLEE